VLAVLCWSGFSEWVHPLGWVEPGVAVVADVDVPPVVVDDAVMVSAKEYQVASKFPIRPLGAYMVRCVPKRARRFIRASHVSDTMGWMNIRVVRSAAGNGARV